MAFSNLSVQIGSSIILLDRARTEQEEVKGVEWVLFHHKTVNLCCGHMGVPAW